MKPVKLLNSFLMAVFFFAGCHATRKTNESTMAYQAGPFDKQGHRGARGLSPENTWPAMKAGLDAGVRTLEMDVVISADKQVVVSHDPFFNHEITTKPDGTAVTQAEEKQLNLFRMDYATISRYDVGLKPHPRFPKQVHEKVSKPLLSGLLDQVQQYMMTSRRPLPFFNIETKCLPATDGIFHPAPAEFVELLMDVIRARQLEQRVIIQSFDFRTLQYLHKNYPQIKTAMLIEGDDEAGLSRHLSALGFTPTIYSPEHTLVRPQLVQACHEKGMLVIPWTVNTLPRIDSLKAMGVDGIITDYPNLF